MAESNRSETWDTEQVLAYVHDVRPWKQLSDREKVEWCRRVKYVRGNVTTDGQRWTNEKLAGLFGIAKRGLEERFTRSEAISASRDHVEPRREVQRKSDARRYLTDPDIDQEQKAEVVAEAVVNDPELMAAINRAQAEKVEERRGLTAQRKASDPLGRKFGERIALHDLQAEVNKFVKRAIELLPEIGMIPEAERFWLKGEADRLDYVAGELRYMAERGETRTDSELRAITEAG